MDELSVGIIKLLLGISAFVLIGWFGARDKRIGGVLLTFPLLNGIAMLTGVNPIGIAGTIYLVVIWNSTLFLFVIYRYEWLPPLPATLNKEATIILRVVVWVLLWATGAAALTWFRDVLSYAIWLFLIQFMFAALYISCCWALPRPAYQTFREMWLNLRGTIRIACFVSAFILLYLVAHFAKDSRWVGWASALPLPGIFALATLSATQQKSELLSLADTVLVIPFNWLLSRAIVQLRLDHVDASVEIATVVVFWVAAACLVFLSVPKFSRWRDNMRA
jgi:hypothetical protein